jgi:hypothetical protein
VASAIRTAAPAWPKALKGQRTKVMSILSDARLATIKDLDALAPQYPAPGDLPRRNTEYPFQKIAGPDTWRSPAEEGVFSRREVKGFVACARQVQFTTDKVVTALELAYP